MKFKLESSGYYTADEILRNYHDILSKFEVRREASNEGKHRDRLYIIVNNLGELMYLADAVKSKSGIILFADSCEFNSKTKRYEETGVPMIEIYDDYRE